MGDSVRVRVTVKGCSAAHRLGTLLGRSSQRGLLVASGGRDAHCECEEGK